MDCQKCSAKLQENAKFCGKCGTTVTKNNTLENPAGIKSNANTSSGSSEAIIKCGNCGYIGQAESARSLWARILAWICIFGAPIITIIYFATTRKYRCPKCKSTFIGVKKINGEFVDQKSNGVVIFIVILVSIAIIGILSSVVLASLNTARQKGADAAIKSYLNNSRAEAELYYDKNGQDHYLGVCTQDSTMVNNLSQASKSAGNSESDYMCNDARDSWAASVALKSAGYWCVDSAGNSKNITSQISTQTSCDSISTVQSSANINWFTYTSQKDNFSILFPQYPTLKSKEGIAIDGSSMTYSYYSYEARDEKNSFFVYKYIYSDKLNITNEDKVLGSYLSSMESLDTNNKIISSNYTYQAGNRALDFLVKSNNEMLRGRYVLVGETVYLAMMDYFTQDADQATYNKFISSFKIQ